jgi:hypothetical protein
MTRFLLLSNICRVVDVGRSLWREDGSDIYNCYWSSPAQSFSGPRPVGLATIFHSLRFETSFSSPPTTRRATVEVFDPASTRALVISPVRSVCYNRHHVEPFNFLFSDATMADVFVTAETEIVLYPLHRKRCLCMRCRVNAFVTQTMIQETWLPSRCLAMEGRSDSDIIRLLGGTPQYYGKQNCNISVSIEVVMWLNIVWVMFTLSETSVNVTTGHHHLPEDYFT